MSKRNRVRKIINSTFITIDGAVESPHLWPSVGDSGGQADKIHTELLESCDVVLMGRRTYESFAAAWPNRGGDPFADRLNATSKVVVSTTLRNPTWNNTTVIGRDVADAIKRMKSQPGKHIVQYGLGPVSFMMLQHGLLDEVRLWLHPLILGRDGPSIPHFRESPPARLGLIESTTLPNGIVVLRYDVARE